MIIMNKEELVSAVAEMTNETKKLSKVMVVAVLESIKRALAKGDKVKLVDELIFEVKHRNGRKGRNPATGEEIDIEARNYIDISVGKSWNDAIVDVVVPEKVKEEFRGKKKEVVVE